MMRNGRQMTWVVLLLGAWAWAEERPQLLVTDLTAQDATPAQAAALTEAAVASLSERGMFRVLSQQELQAILGVERQRQLLGVCAEDPKQCAEGAASATGARFVLTGGLARLGATYQLTFQMLDTVKGQPVGRSARLAKDLSVLRAQVPYAVAEATGSPLPPPPNRVVQYSMMATGGAMVVGGGFYGLLALSRQSVLNDELCPGGPVGGNCAGVQLRPLSYYQEQDAQLRVQKWVSVGLMAAGVGLAGAGLLLLPPPEGGPRVALVPSGSGMFLVGELP